MPRVSSRRGADQGVLSRQTVPTPSPTKVASKSKEPEMTGGSQKVLNKQEEEMMKNPQEIGYIDEYGNYVEPKKAKRTK